MSTERTPVAGAPPPLSPSACAQEEDGGRYVQRKRSHDGPAEHESAPSKPSGSLDVSGLNLSETVARPVAESQTMVQVPVPKRPATSRARRVELLGQGHSAAWSHGTFAVVANRPDVIVEHGLILAAHPALDPIVDHRLIEDLSLARVQRNRALLAMESAGMTPTLTSFLARLMPLVERLERAVHDRERERVRDFRTRPLVDLAQYRPALPSTDEEPQ